MKEYWETIYTNKPVDQVSWFQEHAERSLQLIRATGLAHDAAIIDVGGGASTMIDDLLAAGYHNLTVLDLSATALARTQQRLGAHAAQVQWIAANITSVQLPAQHYDLWHDRAVFHFLTDAQDRRAYLATLMQALKPGGHVIVATFAADGPTQCSGLPVQRYSADELHAEFGPAFTLIDHVQEEHRTPFGTVQKFVYCYCRK